LLYWDITRGVAVQAGTYRCRYARQGQTIATADALIAATAIEHNAILVTDNPKDYPMPEIRLLSLRYPV
jgi:predicted nucleic acid-binding protein